MRFQTQPLFMHVNTGNMFSVDFQKLFFFFKLKYIQFIIKAIVQINLSTAFPPYISPLESTKSIANVSAYDSNFVFCSIVQFVCTP